jgi:hypothetical protein
MRQAERRDRGELWPWTAREIRLARRLPDEEVALRVGKTRRAVRAKRWELARRCERQAQPFRPFRVILTNGRAHDIRHPEFAGLTHRLLKIGSPDTGEDPSAEENYIGVAVVHIVQYEFIPPRSPSAAAS